MTMIKWKKIGEHTPTAVGKYFPNSPETPFVTCLVWVCNPEYLIGGIIQTVRWDTEKMCWFKPDMRDKFMFAEPYIITHFCDDFNKPLL
jgi:hypothetical protein